MPKRFGTQNQLELLLNKKRADFSPDDLIHIISEMAIEFVTFHYTGLDGKLKELKFPVQSKDQILSILTDGERVDGSSLFKGLIDTACSDLYVVPVYQTAFLNPFDRKSLDFVCRFLSRDGNLAQFAPDTILANAADLLRKRTSLELYALGELEFFLLYRPEPGDGDYYPLVRQSGYHATAPFVKKGEIVSEMVRYISEITGCIKYAHSEVGVISDLASNIPEIDGCDGEQWEIEFLPAPVEDMADYLVIARWIIRNVAERHDCVATFAPKLEEGVAGSGFHFHMMLKHQESNAMVDEKGKLSASARQLIGGLCHYADSLTAFGNTVSSAYLRLVPGQEAPTRVCWSDMNRTAMIRVPLGWGEVNHLAQKVNKPDSQRETCSGSRQTVELRTADGSALVHLMLAGITLAVEWGLSHPEEAENIASDLYLSSEVSKESKAFEDLPPLPRSCVESARVLKESTEFYTRDNAFPQSMLNYIVTLLSDENDEYINQRLTSMPADQRLKESLKIMHGNIHRH